MLLFPGQPPSQSGRYSVSMSGDLTITDVHPEDSGFYICQAISVAGSVMSKVLLEVEGGEVLVPTVFQAKDAWRWRWGWGCLCGKNQLMRRKHKLGRGYITIKLMKEQRRGFLLDELWILAFIPAVNLVYGLFFKVGFHPLDPHINSFLLHNLQVL